MFIKKNGKWEDEGGKITTDKLKEVLNDLSDIGELDFLSGSMPDLENPISLSFISHTEGENYLVSDIAPVDGICVMQVPNNIGGNHSLRYYAAAGVIPGDFSSKIVKTANAINYWGGFPSFGYNRLTIPLHKGYRAFYGIHSSVTYNLSAVNFMLYPLKASNQSNNIQSNTLPELTEERIVATLNGKPVYEKTFITNLGSSSNVGNEIIPDITENKTLSIISLTGAIRTNGVVTIPYFYSTGEYVSIWIRSTTQALTELHIPSTYNNAEVIIKLQYTKTTD